MQIDTSCKCDNVSSVFIYNIKMLINVQAKAYSMNGDNPVQGKLDDISCLKDKCSFYDLNSPAGSLLHDNSFSNSQTTAILIFVTYLLLNALILTLNVLYLGKIFSWIEQSQHNHLKDLYKASAIVLALINVVSFGSDILLHILFGGYFIYLTIKLLLVTVIFVLVIVVSCFYTWRYGHKWKIMHTLALCQFVWFVHRLATDAIISIIAFVIAPAQTLGLVTLLLSIVVCAVLFASSLLQNCQTACILRCICERRTVLTLFCTFFIAFCTVGLVISVTLLFIVLVDNGLQSAGVGGFILSLIPPITIFVIGLCVNRKIAVNFYRKMLIIISSSTTIINSGSPDTNQPDTPAEGNVNCQADETTPLNQRSVAIEESEDKL